MRRLLLLSNQTPLNSQRECEDKPFRRLVWADKTSVFDGTRREEEIQILDLRSSEDACFRFKTEQGEERKGEFRVCENFGEGFKEGNAEREEEEEAMTI